DRDERKPCCDEPTDEREDRQPEASPSSPECSIHERGGTERAGDTAHDPRDGLGPVEDAESDRATHDRAEQRGKRPPQEDPRGGDAECRAETGEHADPVPGTHVSECTPGAPCSRSPVYPIGPCPRSALLPRICRCQDLIRRDSAAAPSCWPVSS